MRFVQDWALVGLPLLLVPLIIHLINQWRYQTKRWGAMMFLLAANRMASGYAKLRQYLILAMRMLAVGALVVAISRPLASGLLALGGGAPDTTLILLDRSPSMQQIVGGSGESKLEAARRQLGVSLKTLGSRKWVLVHSGAEPAREYESIESLLDAPEWKGISATSDLPSMMLATTDWIQKQQPGPTEVWIVTDLRQSDWQTESSQWQTAKQSVKRMSQSIRFHALMFPDEAKGNRSVKVLDSHRVSEDNGDFLVLSFSIYGNETANAGGSIPVTIEIDGARTETQVQLSQGRADIKDYRIPIGSNQAKGFGCVIIPADENLADNESYFVFDTVPEWKTIVVAEDLDAGRSLELAASIPADVRTRCVAESFAPDAMESIAWDGAGLLLWQGALPVGAIRERMEAWLDTGGQAIFFPPGPRGVSASQGDQAFLGMRWGEWKSDGPIPIETWRSDQDLFAATRSGAALPVGQIEIQGYARLEGSCSPLAVLAGGDPLLVRVPHDRSGVYFMTTSPARDQSNLATSGIVFYVAIQRALESGMRARLGTLDRNAQVDALSAPVSEWKAILQGSQGLSTENGLIAGVYQRDDSIVSVNRPSAEDEPALVEDSRIAELFDGLEFQRVDQHAGSNSAMVREVWRAFLMSMILALIVEAALSLPRIPRTIQAKG